MKYDFHTHIDRYNTKSIKWERTEELFGEKNLLPMWVADMDFKPPAEVIEAFRKVVDHGIFGYTFTGQSVAESIQLWMKKRHNWDIDPSWILYSPGVVPSIGIAILALTEPGDKVMLQSPVYHPFFRMIRTNDRIVVNSELKLKDNRYEIDFADFEEKIKDGVKLFLLCNPHNPGGRVWTEDELRKIGEICVKHGCYILSDEIHADLIYKPNKHIPISSLDEKIADMTITVSAPTKTFNLAGMQVSTAIISNEKIRRAFEKIMATVALNSVNIFAINGMEAAYRHGEEWLEQLLEYLEENINIAVNFLKDEVPNVTPMIPDGTYLIWIDCRKLGLSDKEIEEALVKKGKLALESGPKYGPGGEGFVRMNIACSRETLLDGLNRFKKAFS